MRALATASLLAVFAAAGAEVATTAEQRSPTLRIVDRQPLVLRGIGFRPSERVRVTVSVDGDSAARRLRASARGVFSASFARMTLHPCDGLFASAVGDSGSRAKLKAQPQCPPRSAARRQPS